MQFSKQEDKLIIKVVVLAMLIGFGAGVVGQIVSEVYFYNWRQSYVLGDINNISGASGFPELRRVQRFLGIEQDFEVDKSIEKISPALVGIYSAKAPSARVTSQIFLPDELISSGFILTEDGWVISYLNNASDKFVVIYDNKVYQPEEVIVDAVTGVTFIKIPAASLPVVALGDSNDSALGQLEIVLNALDQVAVVNLKSLSYLSGATGNDYVLSSEKYGELFLISDGITQSYLGSPLINLGGDVIGIVSDVDDELGLASVVPINQFRSIILDVLRNNNITRAYLGVDYLDLSRTIGLDKGLTQGLDKGALVYQNPKRTTPAYASQLKEDDIILSVDGQPIDQINSLTDLIQQYQPGDEVTLGILRSGDTISKNVILGVLE